MAADLENARVLQTLIGAAGPRALNARAMYEEVAARFTEELDYALEASRQRAFRALHAGDPHIRIPEVIAERSSRRVLTTELARGTSLDAVAAGDEARRRHYAEVLWRFVFKGVLVGGAFNADPHPDNYLFAPDGEVVFIDFGCVQSLEGDPLASTRDAHRAALQRDEAAFAEAVRKLYRTAPGSYERALIEHTRRSFEPLFASPYRLTAEYVAELVRGLQGLKRLMLSRGAGFTPIPPCLLLMNRLQFGFYSVLRRLDVRVDYAAVEGRVLAEADLLR
jgi:predicted unusual protein kinase regulating ubiquinone biosynthesis (AarF/ABC1/UbiB family)